MRPCLMAFLIENDGLTGCGMSTALSIENGGLTERRHFVQNKYASLTADRWNKKTVVARGAFLWISIQIYF